VTLDPAALDALTADITAQTAALPPPPDEHVAWLAAWLARVDIRLARQAADAGDGEAPRSQGAERGRGASDGAV